MIESTDDRILLTPVTGIQVHRTPEGEYVCNYVGWGSHTQEMTTKKPMHLGFGYRPERRETIFWDIAYGYVSGIPLRAIAWFLLTRSLPTKAMRKRIRDWELRSGRFDPSLRYVDMGEPRHFMGL